MNQNQRFNLQVPFHTEVDDDGVTMTVCRLERAYYAKIRLRMNDAQGGNVLNVSRLPYVIVRSTPAEPDRWVVGYQMAKHTQAGASAGLVQFEISGPGKYRIYIRELLATFASGEEFLVPRHVLPDGEDSGRQVQPLLELDVIEDEACNLSCRVMHPNGLGRGRGAGRDQIPADGTWHALTEAHSNSAISRSLDLGNYTISLQLWADASCTYGINHPRIARSRFREALELIYGESMTAGTVPGLDAHDRILTTDTVRVEFDHQSTTGGRGRLSFREDNGQAGNRMTPDESLRRTHPATMEFLFQMMSDLGLHSARSTGAWRPHFGSTRHRYAAALDITEVKAYVRDANDQEHQVTVHFHNRNSPDSNPLVTTRPETAQRTRKRELSYRVHVYMAQGRLDGTLGWMGGPWRLTFAQLGLARPTNPPNRLLPTDEAFATNDDHYHHIHISRGVDQE